MHADYPCWVFIADNIIWIFNVFHNNNFQSLPTSKISIFQKFRTIKWIISWPIPADQRRLLFRLTNSPRFKSPSNSVSPNYEAGTQTICAPHLCQRKQSFSIMCCKTNLSAKVPQAIFKIQWLSSIIIIVKATTLVLFFITCLVELVRRTFLNAFFFY